MDELIRINYETEQPTISARDLHNALEIDTNFTTWFRRACEYGFEEGRDFFPKVEESTGGRPAMDFDLSIRTGKEICMIQRTEIGRIIRNQFLDLEDAWNSPAQIMARAIKMADREIEQLRHSNAALIEDNQQMKSKALFADAVSASYTSILIGELAKILKQNGVDNMGQNRLFEWLRDNGYLIRRKGADYNMPQQRSMELGLFEIKETSVVHSDGRIGISKTPKITGRGQRYFVNKFLARGVTLDGQNNGKNIRHNER